MKCQNLFSRKNKKKYSLMSSAEILPRVLRVDSSLLCGQMVENNQIKRLTLSNDIFCARHEVGFGLAK